jgi:hypothetical protein
MHAHENVARLRFTALIFEVMVSTAGMTVAVSDPILHVEALQ